MDHRLKGANVVQHSAPYWPSYPTLAKLSDCKFTTEEQAGWNVSRIKVVTTPNNPNGTESQEWCHIWDAAYAHSVYGHTMAPVHRSSVWSASKLFGTSGLRVGWVATNEDEIAHHAAAYVEKTTSGVCVNSQLHVASILGYVNEIDTSSDYRNARKVLLENGKMFMHYLSKYIEDCDGLPLTGKGGFAWFKVSSHKKFQDTLKQAKVRMIPGQACGGEFGWFRASMVYNNDHTGQALENLSKELYNG